MRDESQCPKNILCAFRGSRDLPDALIEVCESCGKKVIYNKVNNQIDEAQYLRDHRRDFLQPYGASKNLYGKIYGFEVVKDTAKMLKGRKSKKQLEDEWLDTRKDALKYIRSKVL